MASPQISTTYRQELLDFRRQLQKWQVSPALPNVQAKRQARSFLARLGNRISLAMDITRGHDQSRRQGEEGADILGKAQLYVFDHSGQLIIQGDESASP